MNEALYEEAETIDSYLREIGKSDHPQLKNNEPSLNQDPVEETHGPTDYSRVPDRETNESDPSANITPPPHRSSTNRLKIFGLLTSGLVIAAIVLFLLFRGTGVSNRLEQGTIHGNAPAGDEASADPVITHLAPEQRSQIAVEVIQQHQVGSNLAATGKITFNNNQVTPVYSQFTGRLVKIDAEVGSDVRAGQIIGLIDTPDIVSAQSDYQQALASERSARTAQELAKRTRERAERLASAEAISQRELQQAAADEAHAADDAQRARSAVSSAYAKLQNAGVSNQELENLAASTTAAARPLNRLVPLRAPIGGKITERKAGLGQLVQAGSSDPLLLIADLSSVWINADLYEDQLVKVKIGALVQIQTPAYSNETFAARVDQIGATVDPDKHTIAVRCVIANRGERLKPGMFANLILRSSAPDKAITVPASALVTEGERRLVYVELAPGKYTKREVETGGETNGEVTIKSGLAQGERVVVRGGLLISAQNSGDK